MQRLAPSIRPSLFSFRKPALHRAFSIKPAELITIGAQGSPSTRKTDVWLGEAHEAFVLVSPDIGNALNSGRAWQDGLSLVTDSQICPLTFYHDTQQFTHESVPHLRLRIPQNLPHQSNGNTSPATLYLFGATHTIALDGTPDAEFARHSRDTLREMKPVLDNLKER